MKYKRSYIILGYLVISYSVQAISLTDSIKDEMTDYENAVSKISATTYELWRYKSDNWPKQFIFSTEDNGRKWHTYVLNETCRYLCNPYFLHEFSEKGIYQKSFYYNVDDGVIVQYESATFKQEEEEYIKAGFDQLPDLHVSLIAKDDIYVNQLENKLYPETSCLPSSVSMMLAILDINKYTTEELILKGNTTGTGTYVGPLFSKLQSENSLTASYYNVLEIEDIIKNIYKGIPLLLTIPNQRIDGGYRKNRLYYFSNNYVYGDGYHCVVITGYLKIGDKYYLEIFDPYSIYDLPESGKPTGAGAFMDFDEVKSSIFEKKSFMASLYKQ